MAKIPFTKFKAKINEDCVPVQIGEETIAVKQYLPIQDKLVLVGRIIEFAHDEDKDFSNPLKIKVFTELEIVFAYTNISFTSKNKEDIPKLYDTLYSSGIINQIMSAIPEDEITMIVNGVEKTLVSVYAYHHSILGIIDTLKENYSNLEFDVEDLGEKLMQPELVELLKGMLTREN